MRRIISASRRTDVPAFYGDWFMSRIEAGWAGYANPFNNKKHSVSLAAEDVFFIVFWSKNFEPFVENLKKLRDMRYRFYFQFTITGNPEIFEPGVPAWERAAETALRLADIFSPDHVLWRFDPIVISTITPPDEILERFDRISSRLNGATRRCYFSFVQYYAKIRGAMRSIGAESGITFSADASEAEILGAEGAFDFYVDLEMKKKLAADMSRIAGARGMSLRSCCGEYLVADGPAPILKASCVDLELIEKIAGEPAPFEARPTREGCGCAESRDVGAYDTCPHGCVYCYANSNKKTAMKNYDILQSRLSACALSPRATDDEFTPPE